MHQRSFSRFVFLLSWLSLLFNPAFTFAQKKPAQPNPRQILDRSVAAMGGKEKLEAIRARQIFGTIKRLHDGVVGKIEITVQQPNAYFLRLDWPQGFLQRACEKQTCYEWRTGAAARYLSAEELEAGLIEAVYKSGFWHTKNKQRWPLWKITVADFFTTDFNVSPLAPPTSEGLLQTNIGAVQVVHFSLSNDATARLFFDDRSGYLLGEDLMFGSKREIWQYSDFRTLDGVVEPYRVHLNAGGDEYEIQFERIVHNPSLDPLKFALPPSPPKPLPTIPELIAQARTNQEKILRQYDQFTYQLTSEFDEETSEDNADPTDPNTVRPSVLATNRKRRKLTSEIAFYRGYTIGEVVSDTNSSGRPSGSFALAKVEIDSRINEKLRKRKPVTAQDGFLELDDSWGKDILGVLKYSVMSDLKREVLQGRPCFTLKVNRATNGRYDKEGFVKKLTGRIWIDEVTRFVMKLDLSGVWKFKGQDGKPVEVSGFPIRTREQTRICDDLWLPSNARGGLRVSLWRSDDFIEKTYSNYRRNGRPLTCNAQGLLEIQ